MRGFAARLLRWLGSSVDGDEVRMAAVRGWVWVGGPR